MNLAFIAQLLASVVASVLTIGGGYLVARKYQKLGGGAAQDRLNAIRKDLDDAMSEKVRLMTEDFVSCKKQLTELMATVEGMRKERMELKQEITDLHSEVRGLRRSKMQDARDVRQEVRATRQDKRQVRQDARDGVGNREGEAQ